MMYVEMSKDSVHGGEGWEYSKCIWSPAKKRSGGQSPYWRKIVQTKKGDLILHLRGKGTDANFAGFSVVASDGRQTESRPSIAGDWDFAVNFLRADLEDYTFFPNPISLHSIFQSRDKELREYFKSNRTRPNHERRHLFYVIQSGKLQCQNGAYLSDLDTELAGIILGPDVNGGHNPRPKDITVATGERIQNIRTRIGQSNFSQLVRANFNSVCCFPGCGVNDPRFLVGAHIARWSDRGDIRGDVTNGLCFCLIHDKAFEEGYFTLDIQCAVIPLEKHSDSSLHAKIIAPFKGVRICVSEVNPSEIAIREHWRRHGHNAGLI